MSEKLKILMIASECAPYAKTGGLADVISALPKALRAHGYEVIVVIPRYSTIPNWHQMELILAPMGVWMGDSQEWCSVYKADNEGTPVYFIESEKYFGRWGYYHDQDFNDYLDNPQRFGFLTQAALQLCRDLDFSPDIVHAHDWQTALAPAYLKIWHWDDPILGSAASVLTIHNIAYQGVYPIESYNYLGLQWSNFSSDKFEDHGNLNLLKGGIFYADMVNTVSPKYAEETRTAMYAYGLAPYLNNKGSNYVGILNGVDYEQWDPKIDSLIPANYTAEDLSGKAVCKMELQKRFLLEQDPDIPLFGVISRFVDQKGLDLLVQTIDGIMNHMLAQFVILGAGEKRLEEFFRRLPTRYPGRAGSYIGYHNENAHLIEAGADFFLMPTIFEPCGLNQMYSLKYGTLPIVRATGGLDDTVQQYNEITGAGTGFKFWERSTHAIYFSVGWAVSTYYDRKHHIYQMMQSAMIQDFSWNQSARAYEALYRRALKKKGE